VSFLAFTKWMMIHSLHMPAEESGSAVVLPINTKKLGGYFKFLKNGRFSQKDANISDKIFFFLFSHSARILPKQIIAPGSLFGQEICPMTTIHDFKQVLSLGLMFGTSLLNNNLF
jgi:hypothetical protein